MRYERQIGYLGEDGQKKLQNATVTVAGCGGLGCNVITQLAIAGIGRIRIIDMDTISESNLNRQFVHCGNNGSKVKSMSEWIGRISEAEVEEFDERIDDDNIDRMIDGSDIIIDCLDNNSARSIINRAALRKDIPLIHGGVNRMYGQVMLMTPGRTACLDCIMTKDDDDKQVIGAAASVIGSIQAAEAIKFITGKGTTLEGRLLTIDLENDVFKVIPISRRKDCKSCQTFSST